MNPRATFADLPLELSEFIILLAVHSRALDDNRTCASLARTSRAIHALVQPSVADTVVVHSKNCARVCAAPDTFASTRCLVLDSDLAPEEQSLRSLVLSTSAFHKVESFEGPLWMLSPLLRVCSLVRAVITASGCVSDTLSPRTTSGFNLSRLTHLSGEYSCSFVNIFTPGGQIGKFGPLTQLSHLVLGYGGDDVRRVIWVLQMILALPKLEYLCVCITREWHGGTSALLAFAQARNEKRLWASRAPDVRLDLSDDQHLIGERLLQSDGE